MIVHRRLLAPSEVLELSALADAPGFVPGRQGTGYEKLSLGPAAFVDLRRRFLRALGVPEDAEHDAYLLRYREGSFIPRHRDPAPVGREHRRLNGVVASPARGGLLRVDGAAYPLDDGDAYVFRPDLEEHEVSLIEEGLRLVFSVGTLG